MEEREILDNFKNLEVRTKKHLLNIGVIAGGLSSEREISLKTGEEIYKSLLRLGYRAVFIDFKDKFCERLRSIDLAFLALHGKYGEDGTVQGLLELLGIPYTGSGVLSSAMAMDKIISKKIFERENIPTPEYIPLSSGDEVDFYWLKVRVQKELSYPAVVKPSREGSTIGISIVHNDSELEKGVRLAFTYDSKVLIERFISGKLLTVSILGDKPVALPVIEIRPKSGFYDYTSKYTVGSTDYIVPAPLDDSLSEHIKSLALRAHKSLDCFGISRVDLILDENNNPYILEVNTMPGMTSTSLVPKAAKAAGIDFDLLVEIILNFSSLKM
ncbi:MAG: D-alanine--D-alanine ligase [Actinobacteria bacterium]|nr:D-alanine--D-alanine ligase [Actinomycetota bacterium]